MLRNGYLKYEDGKLHYAKPREISAKPLKVCADKTSAEYFHSDSHSDTREVMVLNKHVDFGSCLRSKSIESKTIKVLNNTKGKVTIVWMTPASESGYVIPLTKTSLLPDVNFF
jgi:hypothetical protein